MNRPGLLLLSLLLAAVPVRAAEYDECDADFIAIAPVVDSIADFTAELDQPTRSIKRAAGLNFTFDAGNQPA